MHSGYHARELIDPSGCGLEGASTVSSESLLLSLRSPKMVERRIVQQAAHCVLLVSSEKGGVSVEDLAHSSDPCCLNEARPELFPHVLDGIYSNGVNAEGRDKVLDPGVHQTDHLRVLGVQISHVVREPAWASVRYQNSNPHCSDCTWLSQSSGMQKGWKCSSDVKGPYQLPGEKAPGSAPR